MADFRYSGTQANGAKKNGIISAPDRRTAIRLLQQQGVVPIRINEARHTGRVDTPKGQGVAKLLYALRRTNTPQVPGKVGGNQKLGLKLAKRMLELHSGGMSIGDSVLLLSQRLSERKMKAVATELWSQLREGKSFARATEAIPGLFPRAMSPLFEAGEASGDMKSILGNTVDYIEERNSLRKKILASLSYPFVLIGMVIVIMIGFLYYLVPKIQMMIESMGGEMNFFTRTLIGFSEWALRGGPFVLILLIVLLIAFRQWRRTEKGRLTTDRWLIRLPLMGPIVEISSLYQLSNLMSTLMESGINTSENLKLSERTIQNRWVKARFAIAKTMIIEGASFSHAFRQNGLYPESSIDILTVGENTGHLERGLREITNNLRQLLDERLKRLTIIVSAGAMAFAFLMVVFAALGMVLSVLEVSQTISLQ